MRTIYFITSYAGQLLHPDTFHNNCYGSEFALVEIASRLGKDHNVVVFSETPKGYEKNFMNIQWRSSEDYSKIIENVPDIIIISRYINVFIDYFLPEKSKIFVWLHDLVPHMQYNSVSIPMGYMGYVLSRVTKWVPVGSEMVYKKSMNGHVFLKKYGIEPGMCWIIKNGITLEKDWNPLNFKKEPNTFIYSSWAEKGLWNLLDHWHLVLEIIPDAKLNIFYHHSPEESKKFISYKNKFGNSIVHHGRVDQKTLFEAMKKSEYWLFPNEFPETCCTTSMEMGYYGVIQITNSRGELKNNISGNLIRRDQADDTFWRIAIDVLKTMKDDSHLKEHLIKRQFDWCKEQTWDRRKEEWEAMFDKYA